MPGPADSFAAQARIFHSVESVREGEYIHLYHGKVDNETRTLRIFTLAPEIDDEAVQEAFSHVAGQWHNPSTHPNIVSVYERGQDPRPWIAVELVDGQPLDSVQADLTLPEIRTVLSDVAEALRNASLYNTLHLALDPEHIWVAQTDDGVQAVVDDWGLERTCRVAAGEQPLTPFAPPELCDDPTNQSEQADVYRLGAIAYYALTGQPPVTGQSDLHAAIRAGEIIPPSERSSTVPAAVDDIVLQALSSNQEDRQKSVYDFRTAIAAALPASQDAEIDGVDDEDNKESAEAEKHTERQQTADNDSGDNDDGQHHQTGSFGFESTRVFAVGGGVALLLLLVVGTYGACFFGASVPFVGSPPLMDCGGGGGDDVGDSNQAGLAVDITRAEMAVANGTTISIEGQLSDDGSPINGSVLNESQTLNYTVERSGTEIGKGRCRRASPTRACSDWL